MGWPDERVLVVPRSDLFGGEDCEQGFGRRRLGDYLERVQACGVFRPRAEVEEDPSLKQIIPYVMITHGPTIFLLRRRSAQSEARLHNLYSIGVGGHIAQTDTDAGDPVREGLKRELEEEMDLRGEVALTPVGYLNDDSNSVGSVHFGLVFLARSETGEVDVAEKDMMEGRFVPLEEALALAPAMETWSKLLIEAVRERPELAFPPGDAGGKA